METLQRLDFGILAVKNNAGSSQVILSPQGNTSYGSSFVFVGAATPGRYRLSGYPIFTDINVTMPSVPVNLSSGVPGESLAVGAAQTRPLTLRTDQKGVTEFDLGATLTTNGSGLRYQDGLYLGQPTLTLTFLVNNEQQVSYQDIEIDVELRTSLVLNELQALDFGRLAVYASETEQSYLRISPDGQISINNTGAARIIRFGNETPGIYQISTGAAYAPVNIALPSGTTFLTHHSQVPNVARFLATNFTVLPAPENAKLNAQGVLDFQVGATLTTELTANRYQDGLYTGTFSIDVEY